MTTQSMTDDTVEQHLRRVALMISSSVWTWVDEAGLEIVDGHLLLALSTVSGPVGAIEISARSRLPLNTVYPALHHLTDHGYVYEEQRRHWLTGAGRALVGEFDSRYSPPVAAAAGSA